MVEIKRQKVAKVEKLNTSEQYVYDISMKNQDPFFFGNDILLHNTDSAYFSAYPVLKDSIEKNEIQWTKDSVIKLYDQIADQVNGSFKDFMVKDFHCPETRSHVIQAGREIVAESGIYTTKKRYAALVYDEEGKRKDVDGSPGKLKAMGLDLKRADTPAFMQEFLKEVLLNVLVGYTQDETLFQIEEFRKQFKERSGWEKGTPKRANKVNHYRTLEEKHGKANMPGHVRASLNWNTLKRLNNDRYSLEIVDGMKVIVCKLKSNPLNFTSVAYPIDELRLPQWFKDLPFDDDAMEEAIIDKKIENLIGVLNYDVESTKKKNTFQDLFDFGS